MVREMVDLDGELNSASLEERLAAVCALAELKREGDLPVAPETDVVNMHCHSFFSFNAYGYSPSYLAWLAKRDGFRAIGMVDFDVLDGVDELFAACDMLGVRGTAALETRAYVAEFATRDINSPGEPGVLYHMGIGFTSGAVPIGAALALTDLRTRAAQRNRELVARVNAYLDPVVLDYDRDVIPLTPSGNATERHIIQAYVQAAERVTDNPAAFWASRLDMPVDRLAELMCDGPAFQNLIRSRLMKRGGVGYVQPGPSTFPMLDTVQKLILEAGALPCYAFLDGTSAGEQAMGELLDLLVGKGTVAVNIIPDRNWNIADPEIKRVKVQNLYALVDLAREMDLPLNVGTEMNSPGNRLVDDFAAPELAPCRAAFVDGAYFVYGHTVMGRAVCQGYGSEWAQSYLTARRERNAFYTSVGKLVRPGRAGLTQLRAMERDLSPSEILAKLMA
ncbi:MAG: hypothetical protein U0822_10395 [Anaerolineae bacterium]